MLSYFSNTYAEPTSQNIPKQIKLATTNWCPYACDRSTELPGIVYEYIHHIAKQRGIEVNITFYPWARAIKSVAKGKENGLLTAIPAEAPNLLFTTTATMNYQVCFYTHRDSNWRYLGIESLDQIRLGVIADYGYGEPVDSYVANAAGQEDVASISGNDGLGRLMSLLEKKRIDALIDDQHVVIWEIKHINRYRRKVFKEAGCLVDTPFYLALDPKLTWSLALVEWLNVAFKKPENIEYLNRVIKPKYLKFE